MHGVRDPLGVTADLRISLTPSGLAKLESFSSSPRDFNRRLISFQSFITSKDFNLIS